MQMSDNTDEFAYFSTVQATSFLLYLDFQVVIFSIEVGI